jgi:magnesium transporter
MSKAASPLHKLENALTKKEEILPQYPSESAGKLLITNVPITQENHTAKYMKDMLSDPEKRFETVNYVYVVSTHHKLKGIISIKDILSAPDDKKVTELMQQDIVTVRPSTDQERIAQLAIKHNIKAVPVVDHEGHLLGVVPSDTILGILHQEHTESFLKAVGIRRFKDPSYELINASSFTYFAKRLPWLIVGLLGGVLAASVVNTFEEILSRMLILASFLPAIVYIGDAVGTQTQTILIRSLAIEHEINFGRYVRRELVVSIMLAITLGGIIGLVAWVLWQEMVLTIILAVSIFIAIMIATVVAILLPFVFLRSHKDPAVASGPFATVIRDLTSIVVYLLVATFVLNSFGMYLT